jgi:hypothetical protein
MKPIIFVILATVVFYADKMGQIGEKLHGPIWQCFNSETENTQETKNCTRYADPDEDKVQKKN